MRFLLLGVGRLGSRPEAGLVVVVIEVSDVMKGPDVSLRSRVNKATNRLGRIRRGAPVLQV